MRVLTETVVTLQVKVPAGQTGRFTSDTLELKKQAVVRNTATNATVHYPDNTITVRAGKHTLIDHLPDHQAFSTAAHINPDNAPKLGQSDGIQLVVEVPAGGGPATDDYYAATLTIWSVLFEDGEEP